MWGGQGQNPQKIQAISCRIPGYGDGLLRSFERGSRIRASSHDDPDHDMASDATGRADTPIEDSGPEIIAEGTPEERAETSSQSLDPDVATPGAPSAGERQDRLLCLPSDEMEPSQAADGSPGRSSGDHDSDCSNADKNAHSTAARSHDQ